MITTRKLTEDEVKALEMKTARATGKVRLAKAQEYDTLVADFAVGEYGEVAIGEDEKKLTVRNHITKAFDRRGLAVAWRRGKADVLKFKVAEKAEPTPTPEPTPVATPTRSRRKSSATA